MVKLLSFFLQFLQILFHFQLIFSTSQGVWHQQFTMKGSYFLAVHKHFFVGLLKLLLLNLLLEFSLFFIDSSPLQFLFLEFLESFLLFSFFEVLGVVGPFLCSKQGVFVCIFGPFSWLVIWFRNIFTIST